MNDTVIFLVLAGLALIFKWLTSKGSGEAENPPPSRPSPPNEPVQRAAPPTEEERVRRFLEALGVPPGTQAPPPVRPRTVTPRPVVTPTPRTPPPPKIKRSWEQPLPPVVTTPKEVSPPPPTTEWQPEPVFIMEAQAAPETVVPPLLPAALAAPLPSTVAPVQAVSVMSLRPLLQSRAKIRQAIMLREILGPPLGLEPFGQYSG